MNLRSAASPPQWDCLKQWASEFYLCLKFSLQPVLFDPVCLHSFIVNFILFFLQC